MTGIRLLVAVVLAAYVVLGGVELLRWGPSSSPRDALLVVVAVLVCLAAAARTVKS